MRIRFLIFCSFTFFFTSLIHGQTDFNKKIKGICIYIDYPDAPRNISKKKLDALLNEMDYTDKEVNRSFRKYWHQQSRGNIDIEHDIFFYTAPRPSTVYSKLAWYATEVWKQALEWVIENHTEYDWSTLSTWNMEDPFDAKEPQKYEGGLKAVTMISSVWGPKGVGASHFPEWTLSNGVNITSIQGSILKSPWSEELNMFMLCHEAGHSIFNLKDTYDYDVSSGGTAKYSLMSAQGPDVEPIGAPFLYQHKWGHIKEPKPGSQTYILPADGDTIVVIKNIRDPNEYFTIEARMQSTPGNSLFPVPIGLLIWHTDLKVEGSLNIFEEHTSKYHYTHSIEQKDGLFELEEDGPVPHVDNGDIFVPGDEFSLNSKPSSHWWSGEDSGIKVHDIVILPGNRIQFSVICANMDKEVNPIIPKTDWKILAHTKGVSSHPPFNAIDGRKETYYHVPYHSDQLRPHGITIDLGSKYRLSEFMYTANQNKEKPKEGRVKEYNLRTSVDGRTWQLILQKEVLFESPLRQYVVLPDVMARYVRFEALSSYKNDNRTSVGEIDLRGTRPSTKSESSKID